MSENWKDCHSCLYSLQILTSAFVHPDCFSLVIVSSFLFSEFAQKRETMTERPWSEAAKTSCPLPLKLFLLLSAFLTLCRAEDDLESLLQDDSRLQRRKHHHDWDHLTLTQQWPPTACIAAAGHHRCVSNRILCFTYYLGKKNLPVRLHVYLRLKSTNHQKIDDTIKALQICKRLTQTAFL